MSEQTSTNVNKEVSFILGKDTSFSYIMSGDAAAQLRDDFLAGKSAAEYPVLNERHPTVLIRLSNVIAIEIQPPHQSQGPKVGPPRPYSVRS